MKNRNNGNAKIYSIKQTAEILQIKETAVRKLIRNGELDAIIPTKKEGYRSSYEDLLKLAESHPEFSNAISEYFGTCADNNNQDEPVVEEGFDCTISETGTNECDITEQAVAEEDVDRAISEADASECDGMNIDIHDNTVNVFNNGAQPAESCPDTCEEDTASIIDDARKQVEYNIDVIKSQIEYSQSIIDNYKRQLESLQYILDMLNSNK